MHCMHSSTHQWLSYRAIPGEMEDMCGLVLKEKGERVLLPSRGSNVNFIEVMTASIHKRNIVLINTFT